MSGRGASTALLLLPGALTVYLSFNAGGFFPNTVALLALILAAVLAVRTLLARRPFRGFSARLGVAVAAFALFGAWTLLSGIWSDAPGRALLEFDRVLLYLLALVVFGSLPRNPTDLRLMLGGLAAAFTLVAAIALVTRALPEVWPVGPNLVNERLSYPLTYWNALGLLAALGAVLCLHFTSSLREPAGVRVTAAAALPVLGATALLTFSRGGIAAGIFGVVAYALIGRPKGLLSGVLATGPPTTVAVAAALDADLLATQDPTTAAAVAQGEDLAVVVGICVVAAVLARAVLLRLDARLVSVRLRRDLRRPVLGSLAAVGIVAAAVAIAVVNAPSELSDQYDRFVHGGAAGESGRVSSRLTDPANTARVEQWEVAIDAFRSQPVHGEGAGTYALLWARDRTQPSPVIDAHSLYAEVLGELGIVGLVLLLVPICAILGTAAARVRHPNRSLHAVLVAAGAAWALHAGVDWDWETPALTLWLFAAGGLVLAGSARQPARRAPLAFPGRVIVVAVCVAVAVVPSLVLLSQARLDESLDHFEARDCPAAIDAARDSTGALGMRAEPYEVIGYCEMRSGRGAAAVESMEKALDRDPGNWEYRYGLALARAIAGQDPRPDARRALRLNPRDPQTLDAVARFRTGGPREWRRRAGELVEVAFQ